MGLGQNKQLHNANLEFHVHTLAPTPPSYTYEPKQPQHPQHCELKDKHNQTKVYIEEKKKFKTKLRTKKVRLAAARANPILHLCVD